MARAEARARLAWRLLALLAGLLLGGPGLVRADTGPGTPAARSCPGPDQAIEALGPDTWLMPAAPGAISPANRGRVQPLLAHREGARLWLLGTGATPRLGRAIRCRLEARAGQQVTDLINPWPRPEHVMGNRAFPRARIWAHAEVAATLQARCPRCIARLRAQLGRHGAELGPGLQALRLPTDTLQGASGRLGPFHWWRLDRGEATPVTVWRLDAAALLWAPGLLWTADAPELRDATLAALEPSTEALLALLADPPPGGGTWRLVPEQGPLAGIEAVQATQAYWRGLREAVDAAQARGAAETDPPPAALPGVPAAWTTQARHALNWQRAWREREAASFDNPAP
ncbi:MBL fold metallo-hydrolase [Aquariibacter albus]|uniref:Uncharacterized protein n=1 Tax=Aquariibacter albus TaxID=2759899 RepID=A0A839HQ93_9BURK|nr:hypothetical protein [Aquariibacter albus]MBB1161201.1 hypothetical protein [Aquariibacter albus]